MSNSNTEETTKRAEESIISKKTRRVTEIEPIGNYVTLILEEEPGEKKTESGLIIAQKVPDRPQLAAVLEVGPGLVDLNGQRVPMQVKKGDLVLINKHAPVKLELPDRSIIWMVGEGDVLAILREREEEIPEDDEEEATV